MSVCSACNVVLLAAKPSSAPTWCGSSRGTCCHSRPVGNAIGGCAEDSRRAEEGERLSQVQVKEIIDKLQ
jgi:hypothetical protein